MKKLQKVFRSKEFTYCWEFVFVLGSVSRNEYCVIDESLFTNRKQKDKKVKQRKLNEESILVPNTYVVHKFHGIGLYEGTEVKKIKDVDKDYLSIKFGGTDRLYVPSDQINELEVYIGVKIQDYLD